MLKIMKNHIKFIVVALFFISCQETEINEEKQVDTEEFRSLDELYAMITKPTDGKIIIHSTTGIGSQNDLRANSIDTHFKVGEESNSRISFPSVTIGEIIVEESSNQANQRVKSNSLAIEQLFGSNVPVKIGEKYSNGRTSSTEDDIYIPELISFTTEFDNITIGTLIQWNPDPNNKNGVQFEMSYTPLNQPSDEIAEQYPLYYVNGMSVPDNGELILTSEFLKEFPDGADVNITIARGNIDFLSNEEEIYTTGSITSVGNLVTISK